MSAAASSDESSDESPSPATIRLCGACRLPGHDARRCPLVKTAECLCGCGKVTCAKCMVACGKCGRKGHSFDTLVAPMRAGSLPRFACEKHDSAEMQSRVRAALSLMAPTMRKKRELAQMNKRRLAALVPAANNRFSVHAQQCALVDAAGLGGAAASTHVRTAEAAAAVVRDDGATRAAACTLGAFVADSAAADSGSSAQPPPGPLGLIDLTGPRQTVVGALEEALSKRPKYSPGTRGAMSRLTREAGLPAGGARGAVEELGSSNPYFGGSGLQLKRAALRYIQISEGPVLVKARSALTEFVGSDLLFNGCSVTSRRFSCCEVCTALLGCAERADLRVTSVVASLQHFIVEVRLGEEALRPFFAPLSSPGSST
ncbi:hypothetical protein I4F81_007094 [Pyropia yezoensis]|uniref:Uncharacterized protein n=1 Tax=Pyropia yezoensis TaxID=2788 RepID=A0ACC3C375_PYRYE|nr:hypothetical protein I4F81_007094 [Neopyropia yezoensis]